jgi:KipI family sensor histidine kinase inhibitor
MSTGFSFTAVVLTPLGYDTVGYSRVTCGRLHDDLVRTRSVGVDGLLLEVDDPAAWYQALDEARREGALHAVEIVPAASTVLLSGITDLKRAREALERIRPQEVHTSVREIEIPVRWDGEDLAEVRERWGEAPGERLRNTRFTVAFCGFAPGFAYLTGLPHEFELPRRATPRTRVPQGSVATAGPYVGVYPRATPGGWNLLGHTEAILFDPARAEPALLTPGTRVRFRDA